MAGDITASTINGQTEIKDARGNLKLNTVNGRIKAEMDALGDGQSVSLDAVNGEMELALPENAHGTFEVSTVNGAITSDFPDLQPKKECGKQFERRPRSRRHSESQCCERDRQNPETTHAA